MLGEGEGGLSVRRAGDKTRLAMAVALKCHRAEASLGSSAICARSPSLSLHPSLPLTLAAFNFNTHHSAGGGGRSDIP